MITTRTRKVLAGTILAAAAVVGAALPANLPWTGAPVDVPAVAQTDARSADAYAAYLSAVTDGCYADHVDSYVGGLTAERAESAGYLWVASDSLTDGTVHAWRDSRDGICDGAPAPAEVIL